MHDLKARLLKHASQETNPTLCIALREAAHRLAQLEAMHGANAAPAHPALFDPDEIACSSCGLTMEDSYQLACLKEAKTQRETKAAAEVCPTCNGDGGHEKELSSTSGTWVPCPVCTNEAQQQADAATDGEMYFLQDESAVVGNCAVWWAKDGKGYTTKLDQAHRFTQAEAFAQNKERASDIPWPCSAVDLVAHRTIDVQDLTQANFFARSLIGNQ